ncbi:hypothetical protein ACEPAG_7150 [Sanghuangporus baumii]
MSSVQHSDQVKLLYQAISLICQTLFYGIYVALIPFSSYFFLCKKKNMTKSIKIMFSIIIFMFLLSTVFWVVLIVNLIATLNDFYTSSLDQPSEWPRLLPSFNVLLLVHYVFTGSVVVWHAWMLCKDGNKAIMTIPMYFLVCTSIFSTSIIAYRVWQHRQSIRETLSRERDRSTKIEKVLSLLVESGLICCLFDIMVLIASVIRLPFGSLGDFHTPVHVQVAYIYPTIVLVLVSQQRSLKEGAFSTTGNLTGVVSTQLGPMDFISNPGLVTPTIFHSHDLNTGNGATLGSTCGIYNDRMKGKATDCE